MKKLKLITLLTVSSLVLVSCKSTTTSTTQTEIPTAEITATPTEEPITEKQYSDDVISCVYNPSILIHISPNTTDNVNYYTIFGKLGDSFDSISNSALSGTSLLVFSQSIDNDIAYLLTNFPEEFMFKSLFSDLFDLEENADITYKLDSDNVVSCSIVLEDSTICQAKFLAIAKESNEYFLTILSSRLLPNESEDYSDALNACYDSIKYIGSNNLLNTLPSSINPTQESTLDELESESTKKPEIKPVTYDDIKSGKYTDSYVYIDCFVDNVSKIDDTSVFFDAWYPSGDTYIRKNTYLDFSETNADTDLLKLKSGDSFRLYVYVHADNSFSPKANNSKKIDAIDTLKGIKKKYKKSCKSYTCEEILRDPESYFGFNMKFSGEIFQIVENSDQLEFLLSTGEEYGYLYVSYEMKDTDKKFLEGDEVTVYGTFYKTTSYNTLLNGTKTVPRLATEFIEFK